VKLKTQVQTHVLVQASTQVRILLPILPGILLGILLDVHQEEVFARNPVVQAGSVAHVFTRGTGPSKTTFWTGYWSAAGS
jgi:hypothetical protein